MNIKEAFALGTPGPAMVGREMGTQYKDYVIETEDRAIARILGSCDAKGNWDEEDRVNAALLAHCHEHLPKVLEVLEVALDSTCGNVGDDGYAGCIRIEVEAIDQIRAALASASEVKGI